MNVNISSNVILPVTQLRQIIVFNHIIIVFTYHSKKVQSHNFNTNIHTKRFTMPVILNSMEVNRI